MKNIIIIFNFRELSLEVTYVFEMWQSNLKDYHWKTGFQMPLLSEKGSEINLFLNWGIVKTIDSFFKIYILFCI